MKMFFLRYDEVDFILKCTLPTQLLPPSIQPPTSPYENSLYYNVYGLLGSCML